MQHSNNPGYNQGGGVRRFFQRIFYKTMRLRLPVILIFLLMFVPVILLIDPDLRAGLVFLCGPHFLLNVGYTAIYGLLIQYVPPLPTR